MTDAMNPNPSTLVFDIGKTNLKVLVMSKRGVVLEVLKADNVSKAGPPYPHLDVARAWAWLLEAVSILARSHRIDGIVATTHGATAVLVDDNDDLVLPVMDYEAEVPGDIGREFASLIPSFDQTQTPDLPQGLNLGRQLFWQQCAFPEAFGRARKILTYPQYWGWRLAGVAAGEVTSLGCHTHLWQPGRGDFTALVDARGWRTLVPPVRAAFEPLGRISSQVVLETGLPDDCTVYTGIHDSNANFALYLRGHRRPFSLVSTGTWIMVMSPRMPLDRLDPARDTMAIVDVNGNPVPTARYMGGREFELLSRGKGAGTKFTESDLLSVLSRRSFIFPSLTPGGPFMGRRNSTSGPEPGTPAESAAQATLYVALMTWASCRLMQTDGDLIIDGGFANNTWYCRLLASLAGHERTLVNLDSQGTAIGAGMLASWSLPESEWPLHLQEIEPFEHPELQRYAAAWESFLA